jgi:hypothetical protein
LAACSSSQAEDDDGSSGAVDPRIFPDPNGVPLAEADACNALQPLVQQKALELQCSKTVRPCPDFLRVQYQTTCVQYDQGTVNGCVAHFEGIQDCGALVEGNCVLETFAGSEPAGCP